MYLYMPSYHKVLNTKGPIGPPPTVMPMQIPKVGFLGPQEMYNVLMPSFVQGAQYLVIHILDILRPNIDVVFLELPRLINHHSHLFLIDGYTNV